MDASDLTAQILAAWGPLADSAAFRIEPVGPGATPVAAHRSDVRVEVGSCFKAFVAAACCRQVERGALRWDDALPITAETRVPPSEALGALRDGDAVTVWDAAEAMIAVSDNTATDLLLRRIGVGAVHAFVAEAGMVDTRIPASVRSVYDAAEARPGERIEACVSTARDLTRFYARTLNGDPFAAPASLDAFKALLRREDLAQETAWPTGTVCYRKGGYLAPPPILASALTGAFEAGGHVVAFAFAANVECADEGQAPSIVDAFTGGVGQGLHALAANLAAG